MALATFLSPELLALYRNPIFVSMVLLPALLIILDLMSGIGAAASSGTFDTKKLMNVLTTGVLPYLIANVVVLLVYSASGSAVAATAASALLMGGLTATIVASIYSNFREFVPASLMQEIDAVGALARLPDVLPPSPLPPSSVLAAPASTPDWQTAHSVQVPPPISS